MPNEINDASNEYGKENYSAVIRHLNEFLSKEKLYLKIDDNIIAAKNIAIAYFYRGLAKRACLLKQMSMVPVDYNESYQFRFKKNNFFIDADDMFATGFALSTLRAGITENTSYQMAISSFEEILSEDGSLSITH